MEPQIMIAADTHCQTGEGPLWHSHEALLYFIDIPPGRLFQFDPATGHVSLVYEVGGGEQIGGFTFQDESVGGGILLFLSRGRIGWWQGRFGPKPLAPERGELLDTRYNDAIADPMGGIFTGSMPGSADPQSRFYRLQPDGAMLLLREDFRQSNGMGFSPDERTFYHTDTRLRRIAAFDYDRDTGALTEERTFATVPDHEAPPDGLTVDAGGFVWSARYGGGEIVRYRSDGTEERRIALPGAKNITSLAFGGENYEDLYVTTAGAEDREKNGVSAGALFRVRVNGVHGLPPYRSRIAVTPPQG